MADIATIWDPAASRGDWTLPVPARFATDAEGLMIVDARGMAVRLDAVGELPGTGLAADRDLETAVLISLFTDAAAGPDDGQDDARGWWGDATIGSRLWLRQRSKQLPGTLALAKADIEGALGWLISDGVATAVEVETEWKAGGMLAARIVVRRQDGAAATLAYAWAWKER